MMTITTPMTIHQPFMSCPIIPCIPSCSLSLGILSCFIFSSSFEPWDSPDSTTSLCSVRKSGTVPPSSSALRGIAENMLRKISPRMTFLLIIIFSSSPFNCRAYGNTPLLYLVIHPALMLLFSDLKGDEKLVLSLLMHVEVPHILGHHIRVICKHMGLFLSVRRYDLHVYGCILNFLIVFPD